MEIVNFKTLHVIGNIITGSFSVDINIPFDVDEIILKHVSLATSTYTNINLLNIISTNLINDILCVIPQSSVFFETMNTPFNRINHSVQGRYDFKMTNGSGVPHVDTVGQPIEISIVLLFVQYKKSKLLL